MQGKLRCLGSNQHLKSKFGKGYVVQLKVPHSRAPAPCVPRLFCVSFDHLNCFSQVPTSNEDKAVEFVQGLVPSAVVTQRHMGALSFNAPQLQVTTLVCLSSTLLQPVTTRNRVQTLQR